MNINEQFLSSFEKRLVAIINSKEETQKRMQEMNQDSFEEYGSKDPEQVQLHNLFMQQPIMIMSGINIKIDSDELAVEVHKEICRLIKEKAYPVQEVEWFRFIGTHLWHFGFTY